MLMKAEQLPARVTPPTERLSILAYLRKVVRNPLEVWPEAIYRQPVFADRTLGQDSFFVMDPELIKQMLIDEPERYAKSEMMKRLLEPALGNGMLNADGADWRRQRRIVAPIFRPDRIAGYVSTMLAAGRREADRLDALADGARIGLLHEMMRTTFEVVAETILNGADRLDVPAVESAIGDYLGGTGWVVAWAQLGLPRGFSLSRQAPRDAGARLSSRDHHEDGRGAAARRQSPRPHSGAGRCARRGNRRGDRRRRDRRQSPDLHRRRP